VWGGEGWQDDNKNDSRFPLLVNKHLIFQLLGVCGLFALCRRGSDSGRTDIRVFK
jgi:hypothetical protein